MYVYIFVDLQCRFMKTWCQIYYADLDILCRFVLHYSWALIWLHYGFKPVYPFSSNLWDQQDIFLQTTAAHWVSSLFGTIFWKPTTETILLRKSLSFNNYACLILNHFNPFFPHSNAASLLPHVCMPNWIGTTWLAGELFVRDAEQYSILAKVVCDWEPGFRVFINHSVYYG